jgi:SAM-dependent methyltransferase
MAVSIPWYARILSKMILARLPLSYGLWKKIGLYSHGEMQDTAYALAVFDQHFGASGLGRRANLAGLEMGCGDSVGSAIIANAKGFSRFHLVDVGAFASTDVTAYRDLMRACAGEGPVAPGLDRATSFEDILTACNAAYLTGGLQSYRQLPTASVDLIFSHAVLEHVRRNEFADVMAETRRILKPGGIASHQVDLRDHLGGGLNNMRIGSRWWESGFMASSGFYTNRLRFPEMCRAFSDAGFSVEVVSKDRWQALPMPVGSLAAEFRHFSEEDLLVSSFHVLLRPLN